MLPRVSCLNRLYAARLFLVVCGCLVLACGKTAKDNVGSSSDLASSRNPPVGRVSDPAGFFVEVLTQSRAAKEKFNLHKGQATFDDACIGEMGKIVDCYIDAEEQSLYALPFSIHYHVPTTMCTYVSVDPFYFVNRQTKLTTALTKFTDKNGLVGLDNDKDGTVDSTDFGCYMESGVPLCCVGEYPETSFVWDADKAAYGSPKTEIVTRTVDSCLGGPATETQIKTKFGVPMPTIKFVEGKGVSDVYQLSTPKDHQVGSGWIANFFDPAQHPGGLPDAFGEDIDPGAGEKKIGNPYYTIACLDSAGEALASIRLLIREWNTASDFVGRRTNPAKYDENGGESDPWSDKDKNDFDDWLDFQLGGVVHPGFDYKKTENSKG